MAQSVLCEHCESEQLQWYEAGDEGRGAYMCSRWASYDEGLGCARPVTIIEYEELRRSSGHGGDEARVEEDEGAEHEPELSDEGSDDLDEGEVEKDVYEDDDSCGDALDGSCSTKNENVAALLRGDLVVTRQALLPKVLSISEDAVVRKAFKSPCPGGQAGTTMELSRRLCARKRFVPWGSAKEMAMPLPFFELPQPPPVEPKVEVLPPEVQPLILWEAEDSQGDGNSSAIAVDPHLVRFLRPHQREGVQFMFECVAGLRDFGAQDCYGCILADDMGLGKTLQSITLLWTLLCQGFDGSPMASRVIIVTPTSLVSNWESEIMKWLENRVRVLAICESSRADVLAAISAFLLPRNPYQVLIISYETFRMHAKKFQKDGSCDLLICDEAHRLKNDRTLTNQALGALQCRRRVLLSGTPIQNDLEEFYAMVNFTNPGVLGDASAFRRYYEAPILKGREPDAEDTLRETGAERSAELSELVNQVKLSLLFLGARLIGFILRRTNALLSNHLPPKIVEVVCCRLTELQTNLYRHFIHSKNVRQALEDNTKRARVLASITALKKLCNHPKLIYDTMRAGASETAGFEDCLQFFPEDVFGSRCGLQSGGSWIEYSGKMAVLSRLLVNLREKTDDRIVLVSNYTQTLELFAQICQEKGYPYVRLDGTTSISKRQKLVKRFNDPTANEFAFLLSSKAGGCGLNLIGGNRLVLFDPDWNPANDKQAAARVWRDGQKKRVFIYRFLAAGTIEEKVYQRQISKEALQKVVDKEQSADAKSQVNALSSEDLRDLFTLREDVRSDTHETLNCKRCNRQGDESSSVSLESDQDGSMTTSGDGSGYLTSSKGDIGSFSKVAGCVDIQRPWERQVGTPAEEDLKSWAHHASPATIGDALLQMSAGNEVSFVFTCQIDGKLTPIESCAPSAPPQSCTSTAAHVVTKGLPLSRVLKGGEQQQGPRLSALPRRPLKAWNAIAPPLVSHLTKDFREKGSVKLEITEETGAVNDVASKRLRISGDENSVGSRTCSPVRAGVDDFA